MVFKLLNEQLRKWLDKREYLVPTRIQEKAIPEILSGKNVLVIAQTGQGKTLSAILPLFEKIKHAKKGIKVLYITPLRSLNRDIFKHIAEIGEEVGIEVDIRHGDTTAYMRKLQSETPGQVMITTPETLQAIITGKKMKEHMRNVEYVVIDEIHEIAEDKRGSQLTVGLERLQELTGRPFQRIGLSATIGNPEEISRYLAGGRECKIITVEDTKKYEIEVEYSKEVRKYESIAEKLALPLRTIYCLGRIIEEIQKARKCIIFVNTRETAELLASRLKLIDKELLLGVHHSSLSKEVRISTEEDFRIGKLKALIATSSLELGIDIGEVDLVMQYMSPRQVTRIVHRIGRSGHFVGGTSKGIILTQDMDDYFEASAVVKKFNEKWLEKPLLPEKPYDVLAHQIIGICIDKREPTIDEILAIVKRAYPYRNLKKEELEHVIDVLQRIRFVYVENGRVRRTKNALVYYFTNISTIPDEKQYLVIDRELNRAVGIIHQEFFAEYIREDAVFIMKAEPWKVVETSGNKVYVVRSENLSGAIPSWEGELIPVSYDIAALSSELKKGPYDFEELKTQKKLFLPDPENVYIENFENISVIHAPFGSNINNTLSKVLASLLSSKIGTTVGVKSDAYRIVIKLPAYESQEIVPTTLKEIKKEWVRDILTKTLKNSSVFLYRFFQIAHRFGIVAKDAQFTQNYVKRLIEIFENSAVSEEVFSEIFREKMDILGAERIIEKMGKSEIKVHSVKFSSPSPLSLAGLEYGEVSGFMTSEKGMREIINLVKKRIIQKKFLLVCLECKRELSVKSVAEIKDGMKCPACGAGTIGLVHGYEKDVAKKILKKLAAGIELNSEEKTRWERIETSGELYLNYGKTAAIVLGAYGIGVNTARRILSKPYSDEYELFRAIIRAERTFLRNRQFWKER